MIPLRLTLPLTLTLPLLLLLPTAGCSDKSEGCLEGFQEVDDGYCEPIPASDDTGTVTTTDDTETTTSEETGDTETTTTEDTDTGGTTETTPTPDWEQGDPVIWIGQSGAYDMPGEDNPTDRFHHFLDAEPIDDTYVMAGGQGGVVMVKWDGEYVDDLWTANLYDLSYDPTTELVWASTRHHEGFYAIDVSDRTRLEQTIRVNPADVWYEDIAVDNGVLMLAQGERGAVFLDSEGQEIGEFAAVMPTGAAMKDGLALLADGDELVLLDVADPTDPVELDRVPLYSTGRDIAFDGARVAVAEGGGGLEMFEISAGTLVSAGYANITGGSVFSVDLDGDYLWVAAWDTAALLWVGGDEPVIVGHEPAVGWAVGVGADNGKALIVDWYYLIGLEQVDGVAGPELVVEEEVWLDAGTFEDELAFTNDGVFELEVELSPPSEMTVSEESLRIASGSRATVDFTLSTSSPMELLWTSNDPDELSGSTLISQASGSLGELHRDFNVPGFTYPSTTYDYYALEDYRGQVVLLVYFSFT